MKTEDKNAGDKQVNRSNLLKLEDGGVNKDEESGGLRSTPEMDGKHGMSNVVIVD